MEDEIVAAIFDGQVQIGKQEGNRLLAGRLLRPRQIEIRPKGQMNGDNPFSRLLQHLEKSIPDFGWLLIKKAPLKELKRCNLTFPYCLDVLHRQLASIAEDTRRTCAQAFRRSLASKQSLLQEQQSEKRGQQDGPPDNPFHAHQPSYHVYCHS